VGGAKNAQLPLTEIAHVQNVTGKIRRLRRLGLALLLLRRISVVASVTLAALALTILIDYVLRLPSALRALLLFGGLWGLGMALWTYVRPALSFWPDATTMALRIERSVPALRGRLASAVEFSAAGLDRENALAARAVAETERRAAGALDGLARTGPALRQAAVAALVIAVAAVLALTQPALAQTGLSRILMPFSGAQWPARTALVSSMPDESVHARGLPLTLRTQLTMGDPERTRVVVSVRRTGTQLTGAPLTGAPLTGSWRGLVMTHQGDGFFERVIETEGDEITFAFATDDFELPRQRVRLVPPPSVRRATLLAEPPAYAQTSPRLELELGPGTDSRASVTTPVLTGSAVTMRLELGVPIPVPDGDGREEWMRSTLGWSVNGEAALPALHVHPPPGGGDDGAAPVWTLTWRLEGPTALALNLVDEHGIGNIDDIVYRLAAVADRDPSATIVDPASDESVAPGAVVPVVVEARDDIGVALVGLDVHRRRGDTEPQRVLERVEPGSAPAERLVEALALSSIGAQPGDILILQGFAEDAFELDGRRHARALSTERRLRVVAEIELAEQLRRGLAGVRQSAIRLDAQQAELAERLEALRSDDEAREAGEPAATARAQAQMGERLAQQERALDELRARLERNRLDDAELESTLELALDRIGQAGQASNRAAERIDAQDMESAEEAQREVRDELAGLIEMLDRDEDTWLVTRRLEGLQDRLSQLREETARLGERTVGQDRSELPAAELSELERIAAAQRDAAEDAAQLIEELQRRGAPRDGAQDPQAGVLREAARTAEQRELEGQMREAAAEVDANRMANAEQRQAEAAAILDEMMEELRDARRARTRELVRQLASLTESVRQLVRVQEDELIALARAEDRDAYDERSRGMMRLTQNTLGVADEARRAGPEADRAARLLSRAAEAQGQAIRALRDEPPAVDAAVEAEERSLDLLQQALEASEQAQERAEQEEARRERERLVADYRELLNRQTDLIDEAKRIAEGEGRRALLEARRVGGAQQQIRERLREVRVSSDAVERVEVLVSVHERMDATSRRAESALDRGDVGRAATAPMEFIRDSLARIVEALSSESPEEDPFDDPAGGDEGGGGGGDGGPEAIPPRSQLRLLRGVQEQIYDRTRALDAEADAPWRTEELRDLADRQRELADLARRMLETLQGGGAALDPAPDGDPNGGLNWGADAGVLDPVNPEQEM